MGTMVSLTMVGVLTALAAPSFARIGVRIKVDNVQSDLMNTLRTARAEAINRGEQVTVRRRDGCTEATHPSDWRCGWEIFVDHNRNRRREPQEDLIATHGPVTGIQISLEGPDPASLAFSSLGRTDPAGQALHMAPDHPDTPGAVARRLCLASGGTRLTVVEGEQPC